MGKSKQRRAQRAFVASETLEILERGYYTSPNGARIEIREDQQDAVMDSALIRPGDRSKLEAARLQHLEDHGKKSTRFEVTGETTLAAARRLVQKEGVADPVCLNFASAKNPGGGFLKGSQAQEESLARCTGMYPCIVQFDEMYRQNRGHPSKLYSDYMIYSPRVPVFRDDDDRLLEQPYRCSIITAPAVNAGAVRRGKRRETKKIPETMRRRTEMVLGAALSRGHDTIILGAWGCGVFGNEPRDVALWFFEQLRDEQAPFRGAFDRVVFAIYSGSAAIVDPFKKWFGRQ